MKIKLPVLPGEECWIVSILNGVHHCRLLDSYTVDLYSEGFDRLYTSLGPIAPEHCFASKDDADAVWMKFCILNKTMDDNVDVYKRQVIELYAGDVSVLKIAELTDKTPREIYKILRDNDIYN